MRTLDWSVKVPDEIFCTYNTVVLCDHGNLLYNHLIFQAFKSIIQFNLTPSTSLQLHYLTLEDETCVTIYLILSWWARCVGWRWCHRSGCHGWWEGHMSGDNCSTEKKKNPSTNTNNMRKWLDCWWVHFSVSDHTEFNRPEEGKPTWEQTGSVCTISSKPVGPYALSECLLAGFQYGVTMTQCDLALLKTGTLHILSFANSQLTINVFTRLVVLALTHAVIKGLSLFTRYVGHVQQDFHC